MSTDDYCAWVRVGCGLWHRIATGSERHCWGVLLCWHAVGDGHFDKCVLRSDERPWQRHEHPHPACLGKVRDA